MSDRPPHVPPDVIVAFVLLAIAGAACYRLRSVWGVIAVCAMITILTGRCAYVRARGPGGFLFEAGSNPSDRDTARGPDRPT